MSEVAGIGRERAVASARTVLARAGSTATASTLEAVLAQAVPGWAAADCEQVAREVVLLRGLLGPAAATTALVLCLARPPAEPLWADFRRLTTLLGALESDLAAQRRRARLPGGAGRRAAAAAAGTARVLARAAAEFSAAWAPSASTLEPLPGDDDGMTSRPAAAAWTDR